MAPPKRDLVLTGGREAAKRLRVGVATSSAAGWQVPASPGTLLMRRTVLVVLFLMRICVCRSDRTTMTTESISHIGRMVQKFQKVQALMMSKLENLEKLEGKLGILEEKMEGISHEVKKLTRLHSNRHADKHPRQEPHQESATASEPNANIRLRFLDGRKTPIYTDKTITSESNAAIRIGIFDGDMMIREGPLSNSKVEIMVLRGDFCSDGRESWTEEEFNSHIAQGRHGQGFVLGGECSVWLNNGEASLGKIRFKEGSCRTRSRKFVVGARVCMNGKIGVRVQEAIMEPVTVLDRRNEANEKRHPPKLSDEVYRLEEISKDGIYHKRLKNAQIFTVEHFLKALNKDADELREKVLRMKTHSNPWERMVKHARECCLTDRSELKAYQNVEGDVVVFFNCVHDLVGAIFSSVYIQRDNFDPTKKARAYDLKECIRDQLDNLPFNYVMNGNLPEQVLPSAYYSLDGVTNVPDEAVQRTAASKNQFHDRINHVGEPSHQNAYVHADQSTGNTSYYQGQRIPPRGQQQPTSFTDMASLQWADGLLDWSFEGSGLPLPGSGQVNIHSQTQVPIPIDGSSVMEASSSVQHNLLPEQFVPIQLQGSVPQMRYPDNLSNPIAAPSTWHNDHIPESDHN